MEVADETIKRQTDKKASEGAAKEDTPDTSKPALRRQRSAALDIPSDEKSAAERLQEFKDPEYLATRTVELGSSAESDGGLEHYDRGKVRMQREDSSNFSSTDNLAGMGGRQGSFDRSTVYSTSSAGDGLSVPGGGAVPGGDLISFDMDEDCVDTKEANPQVDSAVDALAELDPPPPRNNQSKESTVDRQVRGASGKESEFEMVTESEVKDAIKTVLQPSPRHRRTLRDGFRWQKQLVFRSKLTMHTAFERKDNKDPAAVTALAVSRWASHILTPSVQLLMLITRI